MSPDQGAKSLAVKSMPLFTLNLRPPELCERGSKRYQSQKHESLGVSCVKVNNNNI